MSADVNGIRARLEAASPGPWQVRASGWLTDELDSITAANGESVIMPQDEQGGPSWSGDADAEFIAHAPADIAALLAENERLAGEVEAVREAYCISNEQMSEAIARAADLATEVERLGMTAGVLRSHLESLWKELFENAAVSHEARMKRALGVLRSALEGEQAFVNAFEQVREDRARAEAERDAALARLARVEAALDEAEQLPDAGALYHDVTYRDAVEATVMRVRAALDGEGE